MSKANPKIKIQLGNCISELPKSELPASAAIVGGNYPFFCSSSEPKQIDKFIQDKPAILLGTGGVASVNFDDDRFAYSTDTWGIRSTCAELPIEFLYWKLLQLLPEIDFKGFEGSGLRHLRKNFIRGISFEVSENRKVSKKIATILTTIDTAIEKTQELIDKYQKIKTGLMNDLFTRGIGADGKLRPTRSEAPELYQKTELGWIPKEWGDIDIDGFCADIADCPHSTPNYIDSGYYCIRTADLEPGMLKLENAYLVGEKDYQFRIQRLRPKKNDIIYSREGERLGIAAPVGEETVCLGQRVMILRAQPYYSSQYLLWYMNYHPFYRDITSGLSATTSPHVNVGDIKVRKIPKPGKDEQFEIGRRIQGIQKRIEKELKYQSKLQKQKAGLMQDLLTGKVEVTVPDEEVVNA